MSTRSDSDVLSRLLAAAWPPLVAIAVALAVFLAVLLITPPELAAVPRTVLEPVRSARSAASAYALGAAASLALGVLVTLGPLLAVLRLLVITFLRRARPRP